MHRNAWKGTLLAGLAALWLALGGPALAQEGGFTESFDDATLPGWERSGEAVVVDGALRLAPGSFALRTGDWSVSSLSVRMKVEGEGEVMLHYLFREPERYTLVLTPGEVHLEKGAPEGGGPLGSAAWSMPSGTWFDLQVQLGGGEQRVSIDGQQVLSVTDPQPLQAGAFFFQAFGTTLEIDDLAVSGAPAGASPGGEAPPPGEGEPPQGDAPPEPGLEAGEPAAPPAVPGIDSGGAGLFEEFFSGQASTVSLTTFVINLVLAAVFAYVLGVVYIHWGGSLTNRRKFAANFMLLTVTTTFIILVVRSSVALSLGLVGALSIVRFRAAVKEPEELAYLFFAIGIGIGLGDNQRLITLVAMAAGIALIGLRYLFRRADADVNLHLSVASPDPAAVTLEAITETLRRHTAKAKLLRFDESPGGLEAAFVVEFRRVEDLNGARSALRDLSQALEITFMDNKGIW